MNLRKTLEALTSGVLFRKFKAVADDEGTGIGDVYAGAVGSGMISRGAYNFKNILATLNFPFKNASVSPPHDTVVIYSRVTPVGQTNWLTLPIGSLCLQFPVASTAIADIQLWKKISATVWVPLSNGGIIADPGDAAAIPVTKDGHVSIVTAAGETRTLAIPAYVGQEISMSMATDVGDAVLTVASAIDAIGHTTVTFNDAGDFIKLKAVYVTATVLAWRIVAEDGVLLGSAAGFGTIIADPGTGAAIPVIHKHISIALTIGAVETNTLAIPTMVGQTISLFADVLTSNERTITVASAINVANNTTMEFDAVSEYIKLEAITLAGTLAWQVIANDGVTLA